jgi:hypothetical protein
MRDDGFDLHAKNEQSNLLKQVNYKNVGQSGYKNRYDEHSGHDRIFRLDSVQKTQFERAFGVDLEDVRIHLGPNADDITRKANADAVTIGRDIYFHAGKYAPDTEDGKNLLAHELRHFIHFKEDKRMVYREDIEELEEQAMATEMMMAGISIQNISKPHLAEGQKVPGNKHDDDEAENESAIRFKDPPKTLGNFAGKRDKPLYRIYFPSTGKVYTLTNEEKEKAIERAVAKYKTYLENEANLLPEADRERFLLKHLSFLYRRGRTE